MDRFRQVRAAVARRPERATWWFTFVLFGTLGTVWALSVAPMGGPDEPAHTIKAVSVARGDFSSRLRIVTTPNGVEVPTAAVRVPAAYAAFPPLGPCWTVSTSKPVSCAPPIGTNRSLRTASTYFRSYPPWYYLAVGWPSRVFSPPRAFYLMRIVNALLCAALLAAGFASLVRAQAGAFATAAALLAITPMAVFLMGTINPNAVEIAAAFALWTSALAVVSGVAAVSTRLLTRTTVAALVLTAMRPLSPAFAVAIIVVAMLVADSGRPGALWADGRVRVAAAVTATGIALSVVWIVVNRSATAVLRFPMPANPSKLHTARDAVHQTVPLLRQAVGALGWIGFGTIMLPRWLTDGWLLVVVALVVVGLLVGTWRQRLGLVLVLGATLALPIGGLVATTNTHWVGWQGRYTLPLAIGVPILAGWTIGRSAEPTQLLTRLLMVAIGGFVAVGLVVAHQRLMTRFVVGLPNGLFANLHHGDNWTGPLNPALLFAGALVVSIAIVTWMVLLALMRTSPIVTARSAATWHGAHAG